jgi:Kef-type K+ transport system membrane component KefB/nucleotide-binding universal stress UspA family protein
MVHSASVAVFIAQIVVLLTVGRLIGELLQRVGQPSVTGQILAGVLLGPSILGALAPGLWHSLFPAAPEQKAMLDGVSQLGILLLLLMTGMETDLAVFRTARRPAVYVSVCGIVVPFACGCALGALLPASMLPTSGHRLVSALFLGTALSISSVKIVALVIRDLGFLRRTVGQVILASSILDDTIGWVIVSITLGLALYGTVDAAALTRTVVGTALFLVLSFTVGRRIVFRLVRWSNDALTSEMATVTTILIIAGLMALVTNALGVHFVLGAFVAGILLGQSPLLIKRVDAPLRGLIVALFMPVFFAVAGLSINLGALTQPRFLWLTLALIVLASVGKFVGAFVGGRAGGLTYAESFAVGCGVNARGSTEVIVASIGLQLKVLSLDLFTAIVAMAVVTTVAMPPMLRWAFRRLPMGREEQVRLEREEFESRAFLPQLERLLVAVDASPSGKLASRLAGLLAGGRGIPTTVMHVDSSPPERHAASPAEESTAVLKAAAASSGERTAPAPDLDVRTRAAEQQAAHKAIAAEGHKGFGLLVIGREPASARGDFSPEIGTAIAGASGAFAITIARGVHRSAPDTGELHTLVAVSGTRTARDGAEVAVALAHASRGRVTALHLDSRGGAPAHPWRQRFGSALLPRSSATAAMNEIVELGEHYGVEVRGRILTAGPLDAVLLRELANVRHNLLVIGVSRRPDEQLFLGDLAAQMLTHATCSLLFVCGEAAPVPAPSR